MFSLLVSFSPNTSAVTSMTAAPGIRSSHETCHFLPLGVAPFITYVWNSLPVDEHSNEDSAVERDEDTILSRQRLTAELLH